MHTNRTVRVRIAVAMDEGGEWSASGWGGHDQPYAPEAMESSLQCVGGIAARYWIEVELPIPDSSPGGQTVVIDCGAVPPRDDQPAAPG